MQADPRATPNRYENLKNPPAAHGANPHENSPSFLSRAGNVIKHAIIEAGTLTATSAALGTEIAERALGASAEKLAHTLPHAAETAVTTGMSLLKQYTDGKMTPATAGAAIGGARTSIAVGRIAGLGCSAAVGAVATPAIAIASKPACNFAGTLVGSYAHTHMHGIEEKVAEQINGVLSHNPVTAKRQQTAKPYSPAKMLTSPTT